MIAVSPKLSNGVEDAIALFHRLQDRRKISAVS